MHTASRAIEAAAAGPSAVHRARVEAGDLRVDPAQNVVIEYLDRLWQALADYRPGADPGWRARWGLARKPATPPRGIYIVGPVGRGKSMLMDLFFAAAPLEKKRRVHFHAFMLDIHARLHRRRRDGAERDPIPPLARELAQEAWLLCFDEFQVTNIADAMILGRLFAALFEAGVVVVATSNTLLGDLYAGGLQRDRFLPAIATLQQNLDSVGLDGTTDYRRDRLRGMAVYHVPLGAAARRRLDEAWAALTDGAAPQPCSIDVIGRRLELARTSHGVVRASYAELCQQPLGAADFLALARAFHTLVLDEVPILAADRRDEARRFVTLIDALYEHRCKLICAAAAGPDLLHGVGEHAPEFRRTASRLHEMQSAAYLDAPHLASASAPAPASPSRANVVNEA
jgi:cell division protein ZapE